MANYPQGLAQDAVCQSHTGHMTGLWFLSTRPLRLNTNKWMTKPSFYLTIMAGHFPSGRFTLYNSTSIEHVCYIWQMYVSRRETLPAHASNMEGKALIVRRYPYFDVVVGLVRSHDPESYAGGSVCYWQGLPCQTGKRWWPRQKGIHKPC